jgi:hypothetical protein
MTKAEKTNIDNLLRNAKSMQKLSQSYDGEYRDEKIYAYANAAVKEYNELKCFILRKIRENIGVFFNLKNMSIGSFWQPLSISGWPREGETYSDQIGMLNITFKVNNDYITNIRRSNCSSNARVYTFSSPKAITVIDVWAHTSDTSKPEYNVCSAWSLVRHGERDLEKLYNAKGWREIYCLATWTREQTKLLLSTFEKALESLTAGFKANALDKEETAKQNANVGQYVSVRGL